MANFFYQWQKGKRTQSPLCYRIYELPEESFIEMANWLLKNEAVSDLIRFNDKNYKRWAKAFASQGLSSKDNAEQQLVLVIEQFRLDEFDVISDNRIKRPTYQREIHDVNGLKAIVVSKDDSPLSIAMEFKMPLRKILKYNDLIQGDTFKDNQFVFLEAKRKRSEENRKIHIVRSGEMLYDISQIYGIELDELCKLNRINFDDKIAEGESVHLYSPAIVPPRLENEKPRKHHYVENLPSGDDDEMINLPPGRSDLPVFGENDKITNSPQKVKPYDGYVRVQPIEKPKDYVAPVPSDSDISAAPQPIIDENVPPSKPEFPKKKKDDDGENTGFIEKPKENKTDDVDIMSPPGKPIPGPKTKKKLEGAPVPIFEENPTDEGMLSDESVSDLPPGPGSKIRLKYKKNDVKSNDKDKNKEKPKANDEDEKPPVPRDGYHIVKKGETLYRISTQYKVPVYKIKKWNNLKSNTIEIGQELRIK